MWVGRDIREAVKWDLATYRENIPYLARYLSTVLAGIGRQERRVATARYIEGLLLPARRKFIRPLADRLQVDPQSLQQAIANSPWDDQLVWTRLRSAIIPTFEPFDRWIINERAWTKQGHESVGVSNQRCGANGKKLRCQISVEILASDGSFTTPLAARLYLPADWATASVRLSRSGVPENACFPSRSLLVLELLREIAQDGLTPKPLVGDSSYGNDPDFRSALLHAGIEFFLEVDPKLNTAWDFQSNIPDWNSSLQPHPYTLEKIMQKIGAAEWTSCSWATRDGGSRRTRLALREVFLDSGLREINGSLQRLWFIVDWADGQPHPYRCYLAHFHKRPTEMLALRLSRHRSYLEDYQRCFERDLDLACYQGRSWKGFHHHLVLASAAYLFVLSAYLRAKGAFWSDLTDGILLDSAIVQETTRLASVLLRSGSIGVEQKTAALKVQPLDRETPLFSLAKANPCA
jgi:SRSO17 transposase